MIASYGRAVLPGDADSGRYVGVGACTAIVIFQVACDLVSLHNDKFGHHEGVVSLPDTLVASAMVLSEHICQLKCSSNFQ
jgi:hypothetical protein